MRPTQRRAIGYSSAGRRWTRGDREWNGQPDSPMRRNYPDGSLLDPIYWVGSDSATSVDWGLYGAAPGWVNSNGILPAVTRATALIVDPIAITTWRFYKHAAVDRPTDVHISDEEVIRPLWIYDPQLTGKIPGGEAGRPTIPRPKRLGGHQFWKTALVHALWWGQSAILFATDFTGQPLAGTLRVVNPDRWNYTDDGRFVLLSDEGDDLESDFDGGFDVGGIRWEMRILHGFPPSDGVVAQGVLPRSGLILDTGTKMNSYLNGILGNGVPSGVLSVAVPNYSKPQAEALKEQWMSAHGGARKSVAVLSAGIDFTPLQLNVVDSDAVKAKGANLVDIAHAFNLSAGMLDTAVGTGSNLTYTNLGERRRDLLDQTLAGPSRNLEDMITSMLPWGISMSVEWGGWLTTDPNQGIPFVTAGLRDGWLTVPEVRNILSVTPTVNPELEGTEEVQADEPASIGG